MKYVMKPVEVDAMRWTGGNVDLLRHWFDNLNVGKCRISAGPHLMVEIKTRMVLVELGYYLVKFANDSSITLMRPEVFEHHYTRCPHSPEPQTLGVFAKAGRCLDNWLYHNR